MATRNGSGPETVRSIRLCVAPVTERHRVLAVCNVRVHGINELVAHACVGDERGGPDLPVGLRVCVACVERDAILVTVGVIPRGLHLECGLGGDVRAEELVGVEVVRETSGVCGTVIEFEMVIGRREVEDLGGIARGNRAVVLLSSRVPQQSLNHRHCLNPNHTFDRQVRLIANDPAKSSVEIWLAGMSASYTR